MSSQFLLLFNQYLGFINLNLIFFTFKCMKTIIRMDTPSTTNSSSNPRDEVQHALQHAKDLVRESTGGHVVDSIALSGGLLNIVWRLVIAYTDDNYEKKKKKHDPVQYQPRPDTVIAKYYPPYIATIK